jgi:hypothetical protein
MTLSADRTVDEGAHIACVLEGVATQGDVDFVVLNNDPRGGLVGWHHVQYYTTSWQAKLTGFRPLLYVEYSDASAEWIPGVEPLLSIADESIDTGTTPDEIALKFKFPVSIRVAGAIVTVEPTANGIWDVILYDSDGSSVLGSLTGLDEDETIQSVGGSVAAHFTQGAQTLLADTFYYLAMKPTTTANVAIKVVTYNAVKHLDAWSGGQNMHYAAQTDAGGWSATTTKRPCIYLIVDGIESGGAACSRLVGGGLVG